MYAVGDWVTPIKNISYHEVVKFKAGKPYRVYAVEEVEAASDKQWLGFICDYATDPSHLVINRGTPNFHSSMFIKTKPPRNLPSWF